MGIHEPKTRRWTRAEYYQMADLGWFQGQRVQLIEGEIVEMSPMGNPHAAAIRLGSRALDPAFGPNFDVRPQLPLDLSPISVPEPDFAVVAGHPRDYLEKAPTTATLVVEVADSSLEYDRNEKASLYAKAGLTEYWIVNLVDRVVEVLTVPRRDPTAVFGHSYARREVKSPGETIRPPEAERDVAVADLLP